MNLRRASSLGFGVMLFGLWSANAADPTTSTASPIDQKLFGGMKWKMSAIEEELIQVNMKSSEGNLVFPNMLNERFDSFSHVIDGANATPTQAQYEVFKILSDSLSEQLQKWAQLKTEEVPKVAAQIKRLDLPALTVSLKTEQAK